MSIAVCVRVSRQYSMRMCLLPALCRLHLLPPTAYPLPPTVCCLPLTAAVCRQLPTLATYRLPPTRYRLLSAVYRLRPPSAANCLHLPPTACRLPPAPAHTACAAYVPPTACIRPCTPSSGVDRFETAAPGRARRERRCLAPPHKTTRPPPPVARLTGSARRSGRVG